MAKKKTTYQVVSIFDTETTNVSESDAFTVAWMFNDLWNNPIQVYDNTKSEPVIYRDGGLASLHISSIADEGKARGIIPVIAVYNLMFDVKPIMPRLALFYDFKVLARNSSCVYLLDMLDKETQKPVLRFWDVMFLEPAGLAAMGEQCGLGKEDGWDYNKIRTPQTPLTEEEQEYAKRDVQVIPQYLKMLLYTNYWMKPEMLGSSILTRTGIVRQYAKSNLFDLQTENGKSIGRLFRAVCNQEAARSFDEYAIQHACFQGGLTFTSANLAQEVHRNVCSLDTVSMHHLFINGRYVPARFKPVSPYLLQDVVEDVMNTPLEDVLRRYHRPFSCAFHACITLRDVKLKGCFKELGIGLISQDKFRAAAVKPETPDGPNEAGARAEQEILDSGYVAVGEGVRFAFSKVMSADKLTLFVNEVEAWCIAQVYSFIDITVEYGELSMHFDRPADYVSLQSNILFKKKQAVKKVQAEYREGEPYTGEVSCLPPALAKKAAAGEARLEDIKTYYILGVKAQFNSIFGTQAQNVHQPNFLVADGDIVVDEESVARADNFEKPHGALVQYTYGMRISAGSRMHLIIAIMLISELLGDRAQILAGDTDSLKIALADDVSDEELEEALAPLHRAADEALELTQKRIRRTWTNLASDFHTCGHFIVEDCGSSKRYSLEYDAWNKCRVCMDVDGKVHLTCAGLARPEYSMIEYLNDLIEGDEAKFREYVPLIFSYNTIISAELAGNIQRAEREDDIFEDDIEVDGNIEHVRAPRAYALYEAPQTLGDICSFTNSSTVGYLRSIGKHPYIVEVLCSLDDKGHVKLYNVSSGETII